MKILGIILGIVILALIVGWAIISTAVGINAKEEEKQEKDDLWY